MLFSVTAFAQNDRSKTIYFESNSAEISRSESKKIDSLLTGLASLASFEIHLSGYTDDVGSDAHNDSLSGARITAVSNYLVSKNISAGRIRGVAYGERYPVAENNSPANRAKNRRVEIAINSIAETTSAVLPPADRAPVTAPPVQVTLQNGPNSAGGYGINVITNTAQMESFKLTTMTTDGMPLMSNVMGCITSAPPDSAKAPVVVLIPATSNPYCKFPDVELFDSYADSTDDHQIKWMPLFNPDMKPVVINGKEYFEWTVPPGTPAGTCKNGDCRAKANASAARIKPPKKYQIVSLSVIYPDANALLRGHAVENGLWEFKYFGNDSLNSPHVKIVVKDKHGRLFVTDQVMRNLKQNKKGEYILKKKMFVPKA